MKTKENKESLFKRIKNKLDKVEDYGFKILFTLCLTNFEWYIIPTISIEKIDKRFYINFCILSCSLCISFQIIDYTKGEE